jgi:hypothetical protein
MTSATLTCTVNATTEATIMFANSPNCIGQSCDASEDEHALMNFTDYIASALDQFQDLDDCVITTSISTSSSPIIMGAKMFLIISSALLATIFLF